MRIEAGLAFGAEKMGDTHGLLSQYELEMMRVALWTGFADAAESQYVKRLLFIVEVVDHHARIEFAEDQVVLGTMLSARWLCLLLLGRRHRLRQIHWTGSMKIARREIHHSEINDRIKPAGDFFLLRCNSDNDCAERPKTKKMPANA